VFDGCGWRGLHSIGRPASAGASVAGWGRRLTLGGHRYVAVWLCSYADAERADLMPAEGVGGIASEGDLWVCRLTRVRDACAASCDGLPPAGRRAALLDIRVRGPSRSPNQGRRIRPTGLA
jgi:hypothetical protein